MEQQNYVFFPWFFDLQKSNGMALNVNDVMGNHQPSIDDPLQSIIHVIFTSLISIQFNKSESAGRCCCIAHCTLHITRYTYRFFIYFQQEKCLKKSLNIDLHGCRTQWAHKHFFFFNYFMFFPSYCLFFSFIFLLVLIGFGSKRTYGSSLLWVEKDRKNEQHTNGTKRNKMKWANDLCVFCLVHLWHQCAKLVLYDFYSKKVFLLLLLLLFFFYILVCINSPGSTVSLIPKQFFNIFHSHNWKI